eukprot:TRINITY_DN8458_c0_g1_i1.p2 TRINITY_DN8458_c0_g1~~TRINITY_DN8458_c0_g1_i1.p2  ORF type:complete len:170 (+),score=15.18 TRINITY_DN8458_c0_g1_i1:591-1100(+)
MLIDTDGAEADASYGGELLYAELGPMLIPGKVPEEGVVMPPLVGDIMAPGGGGTAPVVGVVKVPGGVVPGYVVPGLVPVPVPVPVPVGGVPMPVPVPVPAGGVPMPVPVPVPVDGVPVPVPVDGVPVPVGGVVGVYVLPPLLESIHENGSIKVQSRCLIKLILTIWQKR